MQLKWIIINRWGYNLIAFTVPVIDIHVYQSFKQMILTRYMYMK